ncbi:MAG: hypothetical protein QOD27_2085 [Microbacteriaceae bacterium]|jgi:hypothetical protein|nr:hypothetical protein [Microbacteriaceae bacterium]
MSAAIIGTAGTSPMATRPASAHFGTQHSDPHRADSHRVGTQAAGTHLRLTKRGRRVLTVLAAVPVVIGALIFTLNGGMATATDVAGSTKFHYVTISAGESLWQLAGQIAPSADPRDVISDVVHLNQLASTDLQAGQRLAIPTQYSR